MGREKLREMESSNEVSAHDHEMQVQAQQQQQMMMIRGVGGGTGGTTSTGGGGYLCGGGGGSSRQTSSRWTPTSEQISILKELYYNNGIRSPTADQIQRISARLRQYGKIEGKNVFYWFQNHKARERQKKRFHNSFPHPPPPATAAGINGDGGNGNYHHQNMFNLMDHQYYPSHHLNVNVDDDNNNNMDQLHNKHHHLLLYGSHPSSSSSSAANHRRHHQLNNNKAAVSISGGVMSSSDDVVGVQMGSSNYGSLAMEKSFRECCSISAAAGGAQEHLSSSNQLQGATGVDGVARLDHSQHMNMNMSIAGSTTISCNHYYAPQPQPQPQHQYHYYQYSSMNPRRQADPINITRANNYHHQTLSDLGELEGGDHLNSHYFHHQPPSETLCLFPLHTAGTASTYGPEPLHHCCYRSDIDVDAPPASLELTLNSYYTTT